MNGACQGLRKGVRRVSAPGRVPLETKKKAECGQPGCVALEPTTHIPRLARTASPGQRARHARLRLANIFSAPRFMGWVPGPIHVRVTLLTSATTLKTVVTFHRPLRGGAIIQALYMRCAWAFWWLPALLENFLPIRTTRTGPPASERLCVESS